MSGYERINFKERVRISVYRIEGFSISRIAAKLGRSKSTISRELARCDMLDSYQPDLANNHSFFCQGNRRNWFRKLDCNPKLREEVFAGLRKKWSPEQISRTLRRKFPQDKKMQISHESIYTYIYVLPRGELRAELTRHLRQKQKYRGSRKGLTKKRGIISEMISIEERPKKVAARSLAGHWEGDLIIGKNHGSAIGTLVERKTRALILVPLPGAKHTAAVVRRAFEKAVSTLPKQMRISLTYDQGSEMAQHRLFTKNTKMKVYFCHPASPWERGTCENTNGLIRDYFPKGTDFSKVTRAELERVQHELNERPRKTLGFQTPKEVLNREILKLVPLET